MAHPSPSPSPMFIDQTDNLSLLSSSQDPSTLFSIQTLIGTGSYGEVWKAVRLSDSFPCAIKCVPLARNGLDRKEIGRILNEVKILRECNHPNVVSYLGCFMSRCSTPSGNSLWIVMEFCEGGSAESRLHREQNIGFKEDQLRIILFKALQGLAYLHSKGQMHRDIKAGNILLTEKGSAKLADFGVSTQLSQATLMRKKTVIGTPYWMAPEVILAEDEESSPYGLAADIWSMGITAIELAQGKPPLYDFQPMRALFMIPKVEPPKLEGEEWSDSLKDFVAVCLRKDPSSRPSARDLLQHKLFHTLHPSEMLKFDGVFASYSKSHLGDSLIQSSDLSDTFLVNDSIVNIVLTSQEKAHCGLIWNKKVLLGCESGLWIDDRKVHDLNVVQIEQLNSKIALVLSNNLYTFDLEGERLMKIKDTKGGTFLYCHKEQIFLAFQKKLYLYDYPKNNGVLKKRSEHKIQDSCILQIFPDACDDKSFFILTASVLLRLNGHRKEIETPKRHANLLMQVASTFTFPLIAIHSLSQTQFLITCPDRIIRLDLQANRENEVSLEGIILPERLLQSKLVNNQLLLLIFVSGTAVVPVDSISNQSAIEVSVPGEAYWISPCAFVNWCDLNASTVYSIRQG